MERTDVVVVGAGPVGLLVAAELALQGVEVTVLERLERPDPTIKAGSINVASAEILDRRGLLPDLERAQREVMASVCRFTRAGTSSSVQNLVDAATQRPAGRFPVMGHFAAMTFRPELVDQDDPVLAAHTRVADGVAVRQYDLELLLARWCAELGVRVRRGVAVHAVHTATGRPLRDQWAADADLVVQTDTGELIAGWVVAADGGRSAIRRQTGVDFVGTDPEMVGYQAIADFDDPAGLRHGWTWTPRGVYAYGPVPGRILVARFADQPAARDAPVTLEELQSAVRDVTGAPVTLTGLHGRATRWSDNTRQAATYRHGRVLLAGDAAHVHPPFSGQGLNLGLGDAVNLAWKLAATVHGWAPAGLLDTYTAERHPVAARVLDWTRAQVALMRGDEQTRALRSMISDELLTVSGATTRVVAVTSGVTQSYDLTTSGPDTTHDLVGAIVPDIDLGASGALADHAHDGRFLLVDRTPDHSYAELASALGDRVRYMPADRHTAVPDTTSLLARPDGIIAWAHTPDPNDTHDRADQDGLVAGLASWAGLATTATH